MLSLYRRPIALALLTPVVVCAILALISPGVRRLPFGVWAIVYLGGAAGGLAGWFVCSRWWASRYGRAFRNNDRHAVRRMSDRAVRRLRGRGAQPEVYADLLEGDACVSEDRFAEALALYSSVAARTAEGTVPKLKKSLPLLQNNIAWCLVELGEDPARALALASESATWARQQRNRKLLAVCLGTLGAAQLRNGLQDAAIGNLREALTLQDARAQRGAVLYYLGEALRRAGRAEEARKSYEDSRRFDPDGRHGNLSREALARL